jgi:hypothetical protein
VVTIRPRKIRVVAWVGAVLLVAFFSAVATALTGSTGEGPAVFQRGDQLAMIGLGVAGGLAILTLTRPRVDADEHRIKIRNVVGGYELPWQIVRAVRFERGHPWASLELADDDVVAVMAVQAVDKEYAVEAIGRLRRLHAAHQGTAPG